MNKIALRIALFSVLLAFAVVILGAYTRLVHAGLGCPDWPTCYGHLWIPLTTDEVDTANEKFADTPVEHDKTWPEQAHRLIASSLGLVILGLFYLCYRQRQTTQSWRSVLVLLPVLVGSTVARIFTGDALDPYLIVLVFIYFANLVRLSVQQGTSVQPFKLPSFIAGLVILQGLFGMWTVTLNLWPKVVTLHLLGGFATLSLLWLLLQRFGQWHWLSDASVVVRFMQLRALALLTLVAVVCQIALGGWVSSNYAALACPDFPLCQNRLWPEAYFAKGFNLWQEIGPNYLGGLLESKARIAIHLAHRLGAVVVLLLTVLFAWRLWRTDFMPAQRWTVVLLLVLLVQLTLGVLNVVMSLPLAIAVAHNAVGAVLLITLVSINHRLHTAITL